MILSIISHKNACKLILLAICNIVIVKKYNDRKIVCRYYSNINIQYLGMNTHNPCEDATLRMKNSV